MLIGYDAGTVISFSSRQPSTRCSAASSTGSSATSGEYRSLNRSSLRRRVSAHRQLWTCSTPAVGRSTTRHWWGGGGAVDDVEEDGGSDEVDVDGGAVDDDELVLGAAGVVLVAGGVVGTCVR